MPMVSRLAPVVVVLVVGMFRFTCCRANGIPDDASMSTRLSSHKKNHMSNIIAAEFVDRHYRIERQFVPPSIATQLFTDLVHKGTPKEGEVGFSPIALKRTGDGGSHDQVEQYAVDEYGTALENFTRSHHHERHSLVYYLERMDGASYQRSHEMISTVASPSILENGGTVHLYMSSPGAAALANHTDITDIVVLQLAGAKEWLLCGTTTDTDPPNFMLRHPLSTKLNSCSTYSAPEMESLHCERSILYPGDVLFLPRRVVHSARALSSTYSAHLTFGYNEDDMCKDHLVVAHNTELHRRSLNDCCDQHCDKLCDRSCDFLGWKSCDHGCSCDQSCDC